MAVDGFLKIGDIKGESRDKVHRDWIDILSWSWGMSNPEALRQPIRGPRSTARFQDLVIVKQLDRSTPPLMTACAQGKRFAKAELFLRKAGGKNPLDYTKATMFGVCVVTFTTHQPQGDAGQTDQFSLGFDRITIEYQEQSQDGSKLGGAIPFHWNLAENKED